jgi:hypothetical protein
MNCILFFTLIHIFNVQGVILYKKVDGRIMQHVKIITKLNCPRRINIKSKPNTKNGRFWELVSLRSHRSKTL